MCQQIAVCWQIRLHITVFIEGKNKVSLWRNTVAQEVTVESATGFLFSHLVQRCHKVVLSTEQQVILSKARLNLRHYFLNAFSNETRSILNVNQWAVSVCVCVCVRRMAEVVERDEMVEKCLMTWLVGWFSYTNLRHCLKRALGYTQWIHCCHLSKRNSSVRCGQKNKHVLGQLT